MDEQHQHFLHYRKMDSQAISKLQGPKPPALMVSRNSTKIKKQHLPHQNGSPVIVYLRSPKVIHVRPEEFMGLVQQLTGKPISADAAAHSPSDPGSSMKATRQKMEKGSTIITMDERQIEGFIGSLGPRGLSVDFPALTHFVDYV